MTKNELLRLLEGVRQSVLFGYLLNQFYELPGAAQLFQQLMDANPRFEIRDHTGKRTESTSELARSLANPRDRHLVRGNYLLMLDFNLIRLSFECVKMYCEEHKCMADLQADEDLYQFARIARNLVSHGDGAILDSWPDKLTKKGITEVTWRGVTLRDSDVKTHKRIDSRVAFFLHEDLVRLARRLP